MNRVAVINQLIQERKYTSYLELGIYDKSTYNSIICDNKESVDINSNFNPTYAMSTDSFFMGNNKKYDLIFIDANHTEPYLLRDIHNSIACLNPNGCITCHDVNPPDEYSQIDSNNLYQTAWRAFVRYRFDTQYFTYTHKEDCGIGVIDTSRKTNVVHKLKEEWMTYSFFANNKEFLLGLI